MYVYNKIISNMQYELIKITFESKGVSFIPLKYTKISILDNLELNERKPN